MGYMEIKYRKSEIRNISVRITLYILILLIWTGCSNSKQNGLVYSEDFENMRTCNPRFLSDKCAHSGTYANELNAEKIYGKTTSFKFEHFSPKKIKGIFVIFWVYLSDADSKGQFVVEVKEPNSRNQYRKEINFDTAIAPAGKWTQMSLHYTFETPNVSLPDNTISIYPCNLSKENIYIDDVTINFEI